MYNMQYRFLFYKIRLVFRPNCLNGMECSLSNRVAPAYGIIAITYLHLSLEAHIFESTYESNRKMHAHVSSHMMKMWCTEEEIKTKKYITIEKYAKREQKS